MRASTLGKLMAGLVIIVGAAGCGSNSSPDDGTSSSPAAPSSGTTMTTGPSKPITIEVTGSCKNGGTMHLKSSGFTPNGKYSTQAWYPDGRKYTFIEDGTADAQGATPNWSWSCTVTANGERDPAGTYKLLMTDLSTGRTAQTALVVAY